MKSIRAGSSREAWLVMQVLRLKYFLVWSVLLLGGTAQAQIVPDGTLGRERSQVNPVVPGADLIEGGAVRGTNLFHSFRTFNVGDGAFVYFANPTGIQNIFTRVTGNLPSNINGVLGVDGTANLFLLNPNGLIFGQNARLDVRGSFAGSTANAIQFGNQGAFSTVNPQAPPLLTVQPSALSFSQAQAGIDVRSRLAVPESQNLLLIGGNVNLQQAELSAPGGRIELAAVAKPETIELNGLQLEFSNQTPRANIAIDQSRVSASGTNGGSIRLIANDINITGQSLLETGSIAPIDAPPAQSGDITIDATGTVSLTQSSLLSSALLGSTERPGAITVNAQSLNLADQASIQTTALSLGRAGDITLNVQDELRLTNGSIAGSVLLFTQGGQAGNLNINTGSLLLENGSFLGSLPVFAISNAGNINIQARDRIVLRGANADGNSSAILSPPALSQGKGGDITIQTGSLLLEPGTLIISGTLGEGDAGKITINALNDIVFNGGLATSSVLPGATGKGGDINVQADSIGLLNGGAFLAASAGNGSAGNIQVNSRKDITIRGSSAITPSGLSTRLELDPNNPGAPGTGGDITIKAENLSLSDEGAIATGNVGRPGNSGALFIDVRDRLSLSNNAVLSTFTLGQGDAGKMSIQAGNSVSLDQNSTILTSSFSLRSAFEFVETVGFSREQVAALAGLSVADFERTLALFAPTAGASNDLDIRTGLLRLSGGSTIATGTGSGDGGNIQLQLNRGLILRSGSGIFATAGIFEQGGNGGNVTINSPFIVAVPRENSTITANAFTGRGGNIEINTSGLYGIEPRSSLPDFRNPQVTTGSQISASSQLGVQGNINIVRPEVEPTQGTIELPVTPIPGNQIAQVCSRGRSGFGSFVVSGRGSTPPTPIGTLEGTGTLPPLATVEPSRSEVHSRERVPEAAQISPEGAIAEAQGWIKSPDGKIELVARSTERNLPTGVGCPQEAASVVDRQK